jgi:hypothetical protein
VNDADAAVGLKGQCTEVFDFRFFHESVSPQPLSILLGLFQIFSKFRGYIRSPSCTIGVVDTGAIATVIKDTGGTGGAP